MTGDVIVLHKWQSFNSINKRGKNPYHVPTPVLFEAPRIRFDFLINYCVGLFSWFPMMRLFFIHCISLIVSELEICLFMVCYFIYFFKMLLFWLDGDCRMVHFLQTVEDIINNIAQTQRYHHEDATRTMSCNQIEAGSM